MTRVIRAGRRCMITIQEQTSVRQAYPEAEFVVFTPTSKVAHIVVSTSRMIPICGRDMTNSVKIYLKS